MYNAVFLTRFARARARRSVILTSAPLADVGLADMTVSPPGAFTCTGSKGREYLDPKGRRRQHPIGSFIVDFYCAAQRLVIELDGGIHKMQVEQDEERIAQIESMGYRVLRFRNEEVEEDIEVVLSKIVERCEENMN